MRLTILKISVLLLAIMLVLAACGSNEANDPAGAGDTANGQDQSSGEDSDGNTIEGSEPVRLLERAEVVQQSDGRWLFTAYAERSGQPYVDAYWMSIDADTELLDERGGVLTAADIAVGATVEAWNIGVVAESYPAQTRAARIILLDEGNASDSDQDDVYIEVSRSEAVRHALESASTAAVEGFPLAVKRAEFLTDAGYWQVELVEATRVDQPIILHIDAYTGDHLPEPVAENQAFRVYEPEPGSTQQPGFTVRGHARVFEAAFSWQLEDGHNILSEGHEMAAAGGPAWGSFEFTVPYEIASQPNMMLILFVSSAKDGSQEHQLIIPLKVPEDRIVYSADRDPGLQEPEEQESTDQEEPEFHILPIGGMSE